MLLELGHAGVKRHRASVHRNEQRQPPGCGVRRTAPRHRRLRPRAAGARFEMPGELGAPEPHLLRSELARLLLRFAALCNLQARSRQRRWFDGRRGSLLETDRQTDGVANRTLAEAVHPSTTLQ
jgi:hypothetical protein